MRDDRRTPADATCEELLGFLDDYLSGELSVERRGAFEAHLAECPSCVAYLRTYQEAVRLAHELAGPEEAPPLPAELVAAILASR